MKTHICSPYLGKTILLYYILVKRLFEQKPTIFQDVNAHLYVFNANGVKAVDASMVVHPHSEEYRNTWALVDINPELLKPGTMLSKENSPFFLVMASPPRPSRLQELLKCGRPGSHWIMKPFSLVELIQASVFLTKISSFVTYMIFQSSPSTDCSRGIRYCEFF